ncbi:MAG: type I restriction-modification system subunit M N-terminal domain-containing protein [Demequina sp.]
MSKLSNFVWSIADNLRGPFKPHEYGDVILPFTILRRLDCILAPYREQVDAILQASEGEEYRARFAIKKQTGLTFHNSSPWTLERIVNGDPGDLLADLTEYANRFSEGIDVFERFSFAETLGRLEDKNLLLIVARKFAGVDLHPSTVDNSEMGDQFEDLIRRFAEASNETEVTSVVEMVLRVLMDDERLVEQATVNNPDQFVESPDLTESVLETIMSSADVHKKFSEYMVGQGQGVQGIIRSIGKAMHGRVQKVA